MKYVIIRDDDTNALTPVEHLDRLYRPFLDRGLPVNLATIPNVNTEARRPDGDLELFLMARNGTTAKYVPIGSNQKLVRYLRDNSHFHILQHGCCHELIGATSEFGHEERSDISKRLDEGGKLLAEAGFAKPATFVAPHDQLSRVSLEEVSRRFRVLSTGWFQLNKLPFSWIPKYAVKKIFRQPHWSVGQTILLTHPGCHLSCFRPYNNMLDTIKASIDSRQLTVLVTHWWEYFREQKPDDRFINILHETAAYLTERKDIRVVAFDDLAKGNIALN